MTFEFSGNEIITNSEKADTSLAELDRPQLCATALVFNSDYEILIMKKPHKSNEIDHLNDKRSLERNCVSLSVPQSEAGGGPQGSETRGPIRTTRTSAPRRRGRHCPLVAAAAPGAEGGEGAPRQDHVVSWKNPALKRFLSLSSAASSRSLGC